MEACFARAPLLRRPMSRRVEGRDRQTLDLATAIAHNFKESLEVTPGRPFALAQNRNPARSEAPIARTPKGRMIHAPAFHHRADTQA